jgi:RNA polymerase sigma factor (sigma-70 family)
LEASKLIQRAGAGEQVAWDTLVERYAELVWAVARVLGLDCEEAADVGQVVWLRLVQRLGSLRQPEVVGVWLATTARRESLRVRYLRGRGVPGVGEHDQDRAQRQGQTPESGQREAELQQAFGSLPEQCRVLLRLLVVGPPLGHAEIAAALGVEIGSIGAMRARCLDCLRQRLITQESSCATSRRSPADASSRRRPRRLA